ncbi:MAG: flagellin [Pseudomonadota bacterium]
MPQIIQTNLSALGIRRHLDQSQEAQLRVLGRLSSGLRINSARDDAAGLAISARLQTQTRGLTVAVRNANDGISLAQTAEANLGAITESLQRMRELALQAANGTLSQRDRQALNGEVGQLISEVRRVGGQANFNGQNLLQGDFTADFQIGTAASEKLSTDIQRLTTDRLGRGADNGLAAFANNLPLKTGDLSINGVAVPPSNVADDNASVSERSASAIAKAAAINRVSQESGVSAYVSSNHVGGTTHVPAARIGFIEVNDVSIYMVTGGVDGTTDRQVVVDAINQVAGRTGVIAADSGSDAAGITLTAADGRNITVDFSGAMSAAVTGLPSADTYTGSYYLRADDGSREINILSATEAGVPNAESSGIVTGTYEANLASFRTPSRVVEFSANVTSLGEGALLLNGVPISAADAADDKVSNGVPITSEVAGSGIATAAAINRHSDATGITATVNAASVSGGSSTFTMPAGLAGTVWVNGIETAEIVGTGNRDLDRAKAIRAINEISNLTGAFATDNGNSITLTTPDGRNLTVSVDHRGDSRFDAGIGLRATATGIAAGDITGGPVGAEIIADTTYGSITLTASGPLLVEAGDGGQAALEGVSFNGGQLAGTQQGYFLEDLDVSTIEGANQTLVSIDNALDQVNAARARLGAMQNRLDKVIGELAIRQENLSAANSRILDADYAAESAELAKTTILQQAGASLLAQANVQPELVLGLLP